MQAEPSPRGPPPPRPLVPETLRLMFPGSPVAVRNALSGFLGWLAPLDLDEEETGTAELVLAEALNNVVEHAYRDAAPGWVQLRCRKRADGIHVTIRDRGAPMPRRHAPTGRLADVVLTPVEVSEGGYGWFIIRGLARDIAYRREAGMNVLSFRLAIGIDGPEFG